MCLAPKDLNKVIKREHHPVPTVDDISPKLCGSTLFSKLDAKQGYWNVKHDKESLYLTTFNTHRGRYRFCRIPLGLRMSQDIFRRKLMRLIRNAEELQMTSMCLAQNQYMTTVSYGAAQHQRSSP